MTESSTATQTTTTESHGGDPAGTGRQVMPRKLAVACLAATVVLTAAHVWLMPEVPNTNEALLESLADAPAQSAAAAASFTLSQLFFIGVVLTIGDVARSRSPRLIGAGMLLAIIGAFGHSVFGGLRLALFGMLSETGRTEYISALDRTYASPVMLFAVLGLIGTIFGLLLLAIGLAKSRAVAVWIPACMIGFLILEFVGSNLSSWASSGAVVLYGAALLGLAATVLRTEPTK